MNRMDWPERGVLEKDVIPAKAGMTTSSSESAQASFRFRHRAQAKGTGKGDGGVSPRKGDTEGTEG
jgi:hypothetical protein